MIQVFVCERINKNKRKLEINGGDIQLMFSILKLYINCKCAFSWYVKYIISTVLFSAHIHILIPWHEGDLSLGSKLVAI
jgi:hypothetical protein